MAFENNRDLLAPLLAKTLKTPGPWRITGPIVKTRKADIFKAIDGSDGSTACIKLYRPGNIGPRKIMLQHEALERAYKALTPFEKYAVPKPLAALPKKRILVMEWLDLQPMNDVLWKDGTGVKKRLACIEDAGHWLGHFHAAIGVAPKPLENGLYAGRLKRQLARKPLARFWLSRNRGFQSAFETLQRLGDHLSTYHLEHGLLHGDFYSHNLNYASDSVVAVDLGPGRHAPVIEDIVKFLVDLKSRAPLRHGGSNGRAEIERHEDERFFKAYGRPDLDPDAIPVIYLQLYEILRRWISNTAQTGKLNISARRIYRRRRLKTLAREKTIALENALAAEAIEKNSGTRQGE